MPVPENSSLARWVLVCAVAAAAVFAPACSDSGKKKRGGAESYQVDKAQLSVKPGVVIDIDLAKTEAARNRAAQDQFALCETCGLMLAYGTEVNGRFSTEGMKMDVDAVWINHFTVIGIATDLKSPAGGQPVSTSLSPSKVTELLLLPAGGVGRLGITQGMNMQLMKS